MKNSTLTFIILIVLKFATISYAQTENKDVSITASGSGKTLEDAKQAALRSATEQAFGAFISSKTEMFNDQVVADQMASVSSGNIISYEILNEAQLPDGRWGITLKALLSINKLASFVQAKGISAEIKGGLFSMNIKQQALNEESEFKVVSDMFGILHEILQISFDYEIVPGIPQSKDSKNESFDLPISVHVKTNKNIDFCMQYLRNTLGAISLKPAEVESYKSIKKPIFPVHFHGSDFYLRKRTSLYLICSLIQNSLFYTKLYTVESGIDVKDAKNVVEEIKYTGIEKSEYTEGYFLGEIDYDYENDRSSCRCEPFQVKKIPTECSIYKVESNQKIYTHSWKEYRSISEIEKITKYTAKPRGKVSTFTNGGYLLSSKKNKNIIVSAINFIGFLKYEGYDFGQYSNGLSLDKCDILSDFQDWRIPTIKELEKIYNNKDIPYAVQHDLIMFLSSNCYQSSSNDVFDFISGESKHCSFGCGALCRMVKETQ
jgi:hypothetical protein